MTGTYRGDMPQDLEGAQGEAFLRHDHHLEGGLAQVTGHTYERLIDNVKAQLAQLNQTLNVLETHKKQALEGAERPPGMPDDQMSLPWKHKARPSQHNDDDDFYARKFSQPPSMIPRSRTTHPNVDYPRTVNYPAVMANRGNISIHTHYLNLHSCTSYS